MDKLTRRNFLGFVTTACVFPSKLLEVKGADQGACLIIRKQIDWTLKFKHYYDIDSFTPNKFIVSKGPYETTFNFSYSQDLIDCHNLCATRELAHILYQELEYGDKNMIVIWKLADEPEKQRIAKEELRRVKLTKQEKIEIYRFCNLLRGKHDCCERINENYSV
jgi:hypothetical protein